MELSWTDASGRAWPDLNSAGRKADRVRISAPVPTPRPIHRPRLSPNQVDSGSAPCGLCREHALMRSSSDLTSVTTAFRIHAAGRVSSGHDPAYTLFDRWTPRWAFADGRRPTISTSNDNTRAVMFTSHQHSRGGERCRRSGYRAGPASGPGRGAARREPPVDEDSRALRLQVLASEHWSLRVEIPGLGRVLRPDRDVPDDTVRSGRGHRAGGAGLRLRT